MLGDREMLSVPPVRVVERLAHIIPNSRQSCYSRSSNKNLCKKNQALKLSPAPTRYRLAQLEEQSRLKRLLPCLGNYPLFGAAT